MIENNRIDNNIYFNRKKKDLFVIKYIILVIFKLKQEREREKERFNQL
jgi:hypothetical protein